MEAENRFVTNTFSELEDANRSPIFGYEDSPVLTLEEAVEKIVPRISHIMDYVARAKKESNQDSNLLTQDESAAIYLYTMATPFVSSLNKTLRTENRHELKPWFAFLKLFITALKKLPSTKETVWRGVVNDFDSTLINNGTRIWWSVNSCSIAVNVVRPFLGDKGILFAIKVIDGKDISAFSAFPTEQEIVLMPGTHVRAKCESLNLTDCFSMIQLEEINLQNQSQFQSNYLFEFVKQKYQRNSRIERIMNPSKSYPIEQSYINLAIIPAKEQYEKEKQLGNTQHVSDITSTFEKIYGTKTPIDMKSIFETCKNQGKQVLVFGRAGIGKSTFCRYIAYQWAIGAYWPQYELLALIPLRRLTANRYPSDKNYSLLDIVKKEVFQNDLTEKEEQLLKNQFDARKTLWILDGYDEIAQNVPPHLECLFEQLLQTPHHIITSRPYMNTLSYDVQMEVTGFTDENIVKYVEQFFDQMKNELDDATIKSQRLLHFLRINSSIWGVAHIPVNLELICSIWSNEEWPEIEQLTMTTLYTMMTEWLCRRYLTPPNKPIVQLSKDEIDEHCQKELTFLENLAFSAIDNNTIIIRPSLLTQALKEAKVSLQDHPNILNIGILKSFNKKGTGTQIEVDKDHYFVHLSFQEYFAARYLINTIKQSPTPKVIEFIKHQKYNQRYALVFTFAAGILNEKDPKTCFDIFWDNILGEPLDLVGIRHMQLVITCIEETSGKSTIPQRVQLLEWIANCLKYCFFKEHKILREYLLQWLPRAQSVVCDQIIMNVFVDLLEDNNTEMRATVLKFLSKLRILNPSIALITSVATKIEDKNELIRECACLALGLMSEKNATSEVISKLVNALSDESKRVRSCACQTFSIVDKKAATDEVISKLATALSDNDEYVRWSAGYALDRIGKKAATNEVISELVTVIESDKKYVRFPASVSLSNMGEKAANNEVISKLLNALQDKNEYVRMQACEALGNIGKKAATDEIITGLVSALGDENRDVRWWACRVLSDIDKKEAMNKIINGLLIALGDQDMFVRQCACQSLGKMGEKVATNEVISRIVDIVNSSNDWLNDSYAATSAVSKILSSSDAIKQLKPEIISNLPLSKDIPDWLENLSSDQLINVFFTTRERRWLFPVFRFMLLRGVAVTATESKGMLYDRKEPLELSTSNIELRQQLTEHFTEQRKELRLDFGMHEKFETIL